MAENPIKGPVRAALIDDMTHPNRGWWMLQEEDGTNHGWKLDESTARQIAHRFNAYPRLVEALQEARNWVAEEVIMPNSMVSRWDALLAELEGEESGSGE